MSGTTVIPHGQVHYCNLIASNRFTTLAQKTFNLHGFGQWWWRSVADHLSIPPPTVVMRSIMCHRHLVGLQSSGRSLGYAFMSAGGVQALKEK